MTNDVETIKQRLDIVDVIRDYLSMKQAGAHWKAVCPFHHEKSPSFMVNRERQIWHCFGCNEGGDMFTFIQRIENIDFREALKLLADKAGIELTTAQRSEVNRSDRARYLEIVQTAAEVYHRVLRELPGARGAREYLERRGVATQQIQDFQVGFAPQAWDAMTKFLLKKNFALDDCVRAGITIVKEERGGRAFDRFRGRIMFPICDGHGRVIGFTGRVLIEDKNSGGKYVNTPESPLFHKGSVIYALHRAKAAIKECGYAVLVEGQMDVIACHGIGMTSVVACSGTALTVEQLRLLKRYTDELRMAFDADAAGQHAAERSISLAIAEGFVVKIISIPDGAGKDADECIKKNADVWRSAVAGARPYMEHLMESLLPEGSRASILKDARRKHEASTRIVGFIALVPSAIERDHWVQRASMELGVSAEALHSLVGRTQQYTPATASTPREPQQDSRTPIRLILEERILALLQQEFSLFDEISVLLQPEDFSESTHSALYKAWTSSYTDATAQKMRTNVSVAPVQDPTLELLLSAVYSDLGPTERQSELRTLVKRLREISITEQRENLIREIQRAESAGNIARVSELVERYQKLIS